MSDNKDKELLNSLRRGERPKPSTTSSTSSSATSILTEGADSKSFYQLNSSDKNKN